MIRVACPTCGATFDTADANAGRRAKCSNCQGAIEIPTAGAPAPAPPAPPTAPIGAGGSTIVVQVQQPAAVGGTIGPANKSLFVVILLAFLTNCFQYFYLGQTGKGALFLVLDLFIWGPAIVCSFGFALFAYIPYHLVLLIDSIVVTGRIKRQAISSWRFF